jgi:hypothetical protein
MLYIYMRHLRFSAAGVALLSIIELLPPTVHAAPATGLVDVPSNQTIEVEVETRGSLPGYSQHELRAYISRRMTALATAPWHFEPANLVEPAILQSQHPNRVIWTFRILPDAAGKIRYLGPGSTGTIVPPGISREVAIDVLLIRDHVPLRSITDEVSVKGYGPSDANLDPVVSRVLERLTSDAPFVPDRGG